MIAKDKRFGYRLSVADSDQPSTDMNDKDSGNVATNELASMNPAAENVQLQANVNAETGSLTSEVSNEEQGSPVSPNSQSTIRRSSLTARERSRAVRVLSRYTESKASKPANGSSVGSFKIKTMARKIKNLYFQKPQQTCLMTVSGGCPTRVGLSNFLGGIDLFIIVFSFVFISTLMFATTYLVRKVG